MSEPGPQRDRSLASSPAPDPAAFLTRYEGLIQWLHSEGLHPGKTRIAQNAAGFPNALAAVLKLKQPSPGQAFQCLLDHFRKVPSAGIYILTEILMAIDSKRFAVMNQNAVAGLTPISWSFPRNRPRPK